MVTHSGTWTRLPPASITIIYIPLPILSSLSRACGHIVIWSRTVFLIKRKQTVPDVRGEVPKTIKSFFEHSPLFCPPYFTNHACIKVCACAHDWQPSGQQTDLRRRREGSLKSIIDKWLEELLFFKQHSWSLGATRFLVSDAYFARAAKYLLYKHSYPGRARAENYSPSPSLRSFPFPSSSFFRRFWNALFLFWLTLCANWISWETCTIDNTKAFLWQDVGKKSKQNIIRKVFDLVASSSM